VMQPMAARFAQQFPSAFGAHDRWALAAHGPLLRAGVSVAFSSDLPVLTDPNSRRGRGPDQRHFRAGGAQGLHSHRRLCLFRGGCQRHAGSRHAGRSPGLRRRSPQPAEIGVGSTSPQGGPLGRSHGIRLFDLAGRFPRRWVGDRHRR
jgi:hypothetical protein